MKLKKLIASAIFPFSIFSMQNYKLPDSMIVHYQKCLDQLKEITELANQLHERLLNSDKSFEDIQDQLQELDQLADKAISNRFIIELALKLRMHQQKLLILSENDKALCIAALENQVNVQIFSLSEQLRPVQPEPINSFKKYCTIL